MFFLHIEITNYKQLRKIRPELIEPISREIEEIVLSSGGEKDNSVDGLFNFYSTFRETSLTVVKSAFEAYKILGKQADKLYGFSIILSDSTLNDEELRNSIRSFIYQIPRENRIWLFEDNKNIIREHIQFIKEKGLTLVVEQKKGTLATEERLKLFCTRNAHIDSISDTITDINRSDSKNKILLINGVRHSGKEFNLDEVLKRVCKNDNVPILFLDSCFSENSLDPFIWSLNDEIEKNVSLYLDNGELDLWKSFSSEMKLFKNTWGAQQCSDYIKRDFFCLYKLYLKAYVKIRKENSLLPIIICKNMDQWNKESVKILGNLFQSLIPTEGLLPVCVSCDLLWFEDMTEFNSRTIHFKPYSFENLNSRIRVAFPDNQFEDTELYSIYKNCKGEILPLFHSLIALKEGEPLCDNRCPSEGILNNFDDLTLELLFLIQIEKGLIPKEDLLDYFELKGYSRVKIMERMDHLYLLHFIQGREYPEPVFPELLDIIQSKLSSKVHDLINGFTNHLFLMWERCKHLNIENLFRIMLHYGQIGKSLQIYSVVLDRYLNNKQTSLANLYISGSYFDNAELSVGEKDALQNIIFSGKMRSALLMEDYKTVQAIVSESEIIKVHKQSAYSSNASLQYSIFMNSCGDYSRGLNLAKEALFGFQQSGDGIGEAKANIELAIALLGQGKIRTSQDYFEISRRASFQCGDLLCQIRSSFFKSLSDFIFGNISMGLRGVNDILNVAEKAGRREWVVMLLHLKGRILFDLGRYRDCEDNYSKGIKIAEEYSMNSALGLLTRWKARSLIYNERFRDGMLILKGLDQCDESLFFMAEGAYFRKDEEDALEYIDKASSYFSKIENIPGETPLWRDGFSSIEGYSLSRDADSDVLYNQIKAFKLFLTGIKGDINNATMGFSELTGRFNQQNSNHYYYKYFYLFSYILPGSEDDRKLKIFSNSVKQLQSRAGRFDDQKMKYSFLNYNYWNKKITEESVKRNFI